MESPALDSLLVMGHQVSPAMMAGLRIALILVLAWVAVHFSHRLIRGFRTYISNNTKDGEEVKRMETLGRVFRYIASVVISLVTGILVLGELGVSVAPILGAAGIVGVAVGIGAQSLVKDYFAGFFLLLENQMRQGDVVEAGGKAGVVEEITLRYVRMRDYSGNVHFVPNGSITTVTNMTRGHAQAVIDVGVAYRENVDAVMDVMRKVGAQMRADEIFGPKILDDLELAGVEQWAESAVMLRCRFKVAPIEQWNVRREFLRRLKAAFDAAGIEIPFPHITLHAGRTRDGTAPSLPVKLDTAAGMPADDRKGPAREALR